MSGAPQIDQAFLEPLESALLALETRQVPLLIFAGAKMRRFVDQVSDALGATAMYTSQDDFEAQCRSSFRADDTLLILVDKPLAGKSLEIVYAYLSARDIMGADRSQLAKLGLPALADGHRMMILIDKTVFDRHDASVQSRLAEFCTVIGVR